MKLSIACLCALAAVPAAPARGADQPAPPSSAVIVSTSAAPMLAVARLITEDTWNPILDRRIQDALSANGLGAAWSPADPRFRMARAALGARMTRILRSYAQSGEVDRDIQAELGRIGAGPAVDATIAALSGPAGPALVRRQAKTAFIVTAMTATPNGPAVGSPEWNAKLQALTKRFDDRIGPNLPADDGTHTPELEKLVQGPVHEVLLRVWNFAIANATRRLTTAMNLMLFDDQAAIDGDITKAIGGRPSAELNIERLATCQDTWLDWKSDPEREQAFARSFMSAYQRREGDGFFVPRTSATVVKLPVVQVYPESVGMGVGFSVAVEGSFDVARKNLEQAIGKSLKKCETSDGMRTCELEIADKKTIMLMSEAAGTSKTTLVGCYYFYEK